MRSYRKLWRGSVVRPVGATAVALGIVASLGLVVTGPPAGAMEKTLREGVMESVVFILALESKSGRTFPVGSGSGTVIDPSGVILTNYHVIYDFVRHTPRYLVSVAFSKRGKWAEKPAATCLADPAKAKIDPKLDLALIKCEVDMDGRPLPAGKKFPYMKIGTSAGIIPGDDVSIIGYPGIGGETINFTAGKIAGWLGPDGKAGKDWLKTDAIIAGGNSGGAAVDEEGRLVGIPTRIGDVEVRGSATVGQINYLRPVDFAMALKRKAESEGWDPLKGGGGVVAKMGKSGKSGTGGTDGSTRATGAGRGDGDDGRGSDGSRPRPGPDGDDIKRPDSDDRSGVTVLGRLVASDTGRGVGGGLVIFLNPGVKVRSVTEKTLPKNIYTKAIADGKGYWESERPLVRGSSYGVLILAKGYEPFTLDDAVTAGLKGSDRFDVGEVSLVRD